MDELVLSAEVLQNLVQQLKDTQANGGCSPETYMCGGTEGWRRAVYLDMTDSTSKCPSGWRLTDYTKRTCGKVTYGTRICDSVTFPVSGGEYSKVCGKIRGYQFGTPEGFRSYYRGQTTINDAYAAGVSLTYGSPRQHVWTFVASYAEGSQSNGACPCDTGSNINVVPFVGQDYFCESGLNAAWSGQYIFHPDDPLWDGENCLPSSSCCSQNNPPDFVKELSGPTTDDLEARICVNDPSDDVAIELIELYVQ